MAEDLATAVRYHRQGQLRQAAQAYQAILARDAGHADALHLLGVVALQAGDARRAVDLIGRAVALAPDSAAFHVNLGEAYRACGQLDQAAACCRTALRLQPANPEAANNLGLILLAQGDAAGAVEQFRAALRWQPESA